MAQEGQTCNLVPYNVMSNILGILAGALLSSDGAPDGRVVGQSAMVRVHSPTHAAVYAYGKEPSGTPALRAQSSILVPNIFARMSNAVHVG